MSILTRLYTGNGALDIVGRRRAWYVAFGLLVLVCVASIVFRGFNPGIDFTGGTRVEFPAATASAPADVDAVGAVYERVIGRAPASVQTAGSGSSASVLIRSEALEPTQTVALKQALFDTFRPIGSSGTPELSSISDSAVSASWGGQITTQAVIALIVFLVLVTAFLAFYFERSMAVAAERLEPVEAAERNRTAHRAYTLAATGSFRAAPKRAPSWTIPTTTSRLPRFTSIDGSFSEEASSSAPQRRQPVSIASSIASETR